MKITLLYLHVVKSGYPSAPPPEYYLPFSQRWVDTYQKFSADYPHELKVVCCGAESTDEVKALYSRLYCSFETYTGGGSDIGACQSIIKKLEGFVLCMSTPVYFWHPGWLRRIAEAREFFGDGLYGPMASYQNRPHIRTSCWGVDAATFNTYPHTIETREQCSWAESFDHKDEHWQISDWYASIGKPALLVTWKEVESRARWRSPENIFRRGDQSNCPVWDQHVDVYKCAHYHERLALAKMADEDRTAIPANTQKA